MPIDYEWRVETHPDNEENIDDVICWDSIANVNYTLEKITDPVDVCLVKMKYDEYDNLKLVEYFYVTFDDDKGELQEGDRGSKPPIKFQKLIKKLNKPKVIYKDD